MEKKTSLLKKLEAYGDSDAYPFHMPGHKRRTDLGITSLPNPFSVDITEIDGFDDLHDPEGILKESMEHAAHVYGSDRTYYLVNGSTCGILSALCGTVRGGSQVIMARNSHKAAYHAVFLNKLEPVYIYPDYLEAFGIQGGIAPESVEAALIKCENAEAVFITSPTYEGIVSDVEAISKIAHRYEVPLIVDEAHGAHFSFGRNGAFPESALQCGADIVIQSLHKTLPSLTQTAVLHIKSKLVRTAQIEQYLRIFQSSSPSYVLLASIENCIRYMERDGAERLRGFGADMVEWRRGCGELRNLEILSDEIIGGHHVKNLDKTKLVVRAKHAEATGTELAKLLRNKYHLEPEMSCHGYVLLMTSLMDTKEGLKRLRKALLEIDGELERDIKRICSKKTVLTWIQNAERCMGIAEAVSAPSEYLDLPLAAGRISSEFITVYPPGIPALVPGERITEDAVAMLTYHLEAGLTVEGIAAEHSTEKPYFKKRKIRVVGKS